MICIVLRYFQRKLHHFGEGVLPLLRVKRLARNKAIGYGADAKGVFARARGV